MPKRFRTVQEGLAGRELISRSILIAGFPILNILNRQIAMAAVNPKTTTGVR